MKYFGIFYVILITVCSACQNDNWSSSEKKEFLTNCVQEGGTDGYCDCFLEKMMIFCPIAEEFNQIDYETKVELSNNCN